MAPVSMKRISKLNAQGTEILLLDFSHAKETEMINLVIEAKELLIKENKRQLILNDYSHTYASPRFMNFLRTEIIAALPFIERQAIIGLNNPKQWILKGFNLFLGTDYKEFNSREEAINYLITGESA